MDLRRGQHERPAWGDEKHNDKKKKSCGLRARVKKSRVTRRCHGQAL